MADQSCADVTPSDKDVIADRAVARDKKRGTFWKQAQIIHHQQYISHEVLTYISMRDGGQIYHVNYIKITNTSIHLNKAYLP